MKQLSSILYSVTGKGFSMPAFIIEKNENELILIDSGLKKDAHAMIRKIESKWGSLDKISTIIFTHRHADHTGGLPIFLDKINTKKIALITHIRMKNHFLMNFSKLRGFLLPNLLNIMKLLIRKSSYEQYILLDTLLVIFVYC